MDLFNDAFDATLNLLPCDGTVNYFGQIMSDACADFYFNELQHNIAWQHDQVQIAGQLITTERQVAWYGDTAFAYTYSGTTKHALPWTETLLALKQCIEHITHAHFNSCLLNRYANGQQGMAWHSDDETSLGRNTCIASLSLGAQRTFAFKHKTTAKTITLELAHGSLLLMKDQTQHHWLHRLPPRANIHQARISLTFRTIKDCKSFDTNLSKMPIKTAQSTPQLDF